MPQLDSSQLQNLISESRLGSLVLLYGEEDYLIREALRNIVDETLKDSMREFNYDVYFSQVDDISRVRESVETLPMMAAKRVVVLKESQHLKAKDFEVLYSVIERPVDSTLLILTATHMDQRIKFAKKFQETGLLIKFTRPQESQIPEWINKIAKKNGITLTPGANQYLQNLVGSNLIDIDNETKKLSDFLGEKTQADIADIKSVVSAIRTDTIFQLAEAIGNNDRSEALICLANLLDHGESAIGILALVSRHIRILTHVKDGMVEGLTHSQLSQRAGVPSFFMKQYVEQSRRWSEAQIRWTYQNLLSTDKALKNSPVSAHLWLENLIYNICT